MTEKKDLSGLFFGKWFVIECIGTNKHNHYVYGCLCCGCGKFNLLEGSSLLSGMTNSCGCSRNHFKKEFLWNAKHSLLSKYRHSAKKRNLEFILAEDEFFNMTDQNCHYCGIEPSQIYKVNSSTGDYVHNGIDRIDSSKGYSTENCVPCCKQCNYAKRKLSKEEFIEKIILIYNNFLKKETLKTESIKNIKTGKSIFYDYKRNAQKRNLVFDIEEDYFYNLLSKNCAYCGEIPKNKRKGFIHNGIDRINSEIGYTIENIVTCCKDCNTMKNKLSVNEFEIWISMVYNNIMKNKNEEMQFAKNNYNVRWF